MNRGLLIRAFRELFPITLLFAGVLLIIQVALGYILPKFGTQMTQEWLQMDFARGIMQAMVGAEIIGRMGTQMFQSMAWVHPVVLALIWAHAMIAGTRVPAAEVDRGTVDVLLSLPVSRREVFISETVVWLGCGIILLSSALVGNLLGGASLSAAQRPAVGRMMIVLLNLLCLYMAAGGLAFLVSASSDRRGRALTIIFLVLLFLFLLNYLAQFWRPLEMIVFLSPLHYHKPVNILSTGTWPCKDMAVLAGAGGIMWVCGGVIFEKRDLCTV